jgi:hypothetical protein
MSARFINGLWVENALRRFAAGAEVHKPLSTEYSLIREDDIAPVMDRWRTVMETHGMMTARPNSNDCKVIVHACVSMVRWWHLQQQLAGAGDRIGSALAIGYVYFGNRFKTLPGDVDHAVIALVLSDNLDDMYASRISLFDVFPTSFGAATGAYFEQIQALCYEMGDF